MDSMHGILLVSMCFCLSGALNERYDISPYVIVVGDY